ncbi:MAG: DEAD/DEAH box helicase [Legionellaceae bacterium]|nr:DEAD/DEAH box helicase [Legionellaceae bacterium]
MNDFLSFGLPQSLLQTLQHLKFTVPTPIQAKAIPPGLEGKDILGSAQTGTGKTAAFGIPIISQLLQNPQGVALVLAPTRELAVQVVKMLGSLLGRDKQIKTALLIGGDSIFKQIQQLRTNPRLIVGTPGRINDHLIRKTLTLDKTKYLVLDETDRMLDMGFAPQIEKIMQFIPEQRQTFLFSATLPKNIVSMSKRYLNNPVQIAAGASSTPVPKLKQEVLYISEGEKHQQLISQLNQREGSIIVFVKTRFSAEKIAKRLRLEKHSADAIHGNLRHNKRESVISAFRSCKYRIMVATDIAARGLDIAHVQHVINYDLPQCPEDYIHRIGRTARAGAEGSALCFVTPSDRGRWKAIHRLMNQDGR